MDNVFLLVLTSTPYRWVYMMYVPNVVSYIIMYLAMFGYAIVPLTVYLKAKEKV